MPNDISNSADFFDVRDVIKRVEELRDELDTAGVPLLDDQGDSLNHTYWDEHPDGDDYETEREELTRLAILLDDLRGKGGDHEWKDAWYAVTLLRDSYFREYAEEFAEDIGAIDESTSWPCTCIDWEQAARELQQDYSSVDFDGVTYWYR